MRYVAANITAFKKTVEIAVSITMGTIKPKIGNDCLIEMAVAFAICAKDTAEKAKAKKFI